MHDYAPGAELRRKLLPLLERLAAIETVAKTDAPAKPRTFSATLVEHVKPAQPTQPTVLKPKKVTVVQPSTVSVTHFSRAALRKVEEAKALRKAAQPVSKPEPQPVYVVPRDPLEVRREQQAALLEQFRAPPPLDVEQVLGMRPRNETAREKAEHALDLGKQESMRQAEVVRLGKADDVVWGHPLGGAGTRARLATQGEVEQLVRAALRRPKISVT